MIAATRQDYDEKAAARILSISPRTLRRWRKAGMVSHYLTPTGRVRYTLDDLLTVQSSGRVAADGRTCPQVAACVPSTDDADERMIAA